MKVAITGVGLWTQRFGSAAAWSRGECADEDLKPVGLVFDRRNRRRVSELGRAIGDAVEEAAAAAAVDLSTTPLVVGSAIGEASTMIGLLEQMWRTREPMSPAAFALSVHNAASGLISISNKNLGYMTSIAADHDTPAAALLEAAALVATRGGSVVAACADEASPRALLRESTSHWDMLAAAVVLAPAETTPCLATITLPTDEAAPVSPAPIDGGLAKNPQVGMLDLVDAVLRGARGVIALDRGAGRGYRALLEPGVGA